MTSPGTITLQGKLTNTKFKPISKASVTVALWNAIPSRVTDTQDGFVLEELNAKITGIRGEPIAKARVDLPAVEAVECNTSRWSIFKIITISGIVRQDQETPIAQATVAVVPPLIRTANTDQDGNFTIDALYPGPADVTYSAFGYEKLVEKGIPLVKGMILNRTLREKSTGWWLLVLFIPAVYSLLVIGLFDIFQSWGGHKINRFFTAFLYGFVWLVILWYLMEAYKKI